MMKE
jgi:hypothetical protein